MKKKLDSRKKKAPAAIDESHYSLPTQLIYGQSHTAEWDYSHHVIPPITASSTFRLSSAARGAEGFQAIGQYHDPKKSQAPIYVYDRMGEPNNDLLQHALARAEGGEIALVFSTGMAAVHAATCSLLHPKSEIISHSTIYGCSYSMLSRWLNGLGVQVHFTDLSEPDSFLPFVNENTRILYLESPVNPNLALLDLAAIVKVVKKLNAGRPKERRILTVLDNTFATPFCQRPIDHGVDLVLHSLTKGISGFGIDMGGAVITRKEFFEPLALFRKDFGSFLAPEVAWRILNFGLSTLSLRLPRQQESAMQIARFLEAHPKIARVAYPGLSSFPQHSLAKRQMRDFNGKFAPGSMLYFVLRGNPEKAKKMGEKMMDFVADNSYCVTLAVSLGQLRTLIEHPGSMTHISYPAKEQIARGIDPGGIRLSVGIEDPKDIIFDLEAALRKL